jgi:hypothetical protein
MRCSFVVADSDCRTSRSPTATARRRLLLLLPCSQHAGCRGPRRCAADQVTCSLQFELLAVPRKPVGSRDRLELSASAKPDPDPEVVPRSPSGDAGSIQLCPTGQDNGWRNLRRVAFSSRPPSRRTYREKGRRSSSPRPSPAPPHPRFCRPRRSTIMFFSRWS